MCVHRNGFQHLWNIAYLGMNVRQKATELYKGDATALRGTFHDVCYKMRVLASRLLLKRPRSSLGCARVAVEYPQFGINAPCRLYRYC